ncbi:hypothetical protein POM88_043275 [Heracleum sosnowskyi]|uniref:Uncharacterized protein n=1 Tax=Heracleum sosnowskyi TaxID=360622 RepID=A0AAD8M2Z0_9APIA|nr:hypothetical protein POM88_043275 [Heracleum sosnowskyi]
MEIEYPVEAESLRKLCYKSMKRGLDFFSPPSHDYSASDPVSKKTRLSHKLANFQDAGSQNRFDKSQFLPDDSTSTLALSVPRNPLPKKEGYQPNSLGNEAGFAGKSGEILVSDHASSNKFSSAAIMEGSSDRRKSLVQRPGTEVMTEVFDFGTGKLAKIFNISSQKFNLVPWTAKLQYMLPHLMSQVQDW